MILSNILNVGLAGFKTRNPITIESCTRIAIVEATAISPFTDPGMFSRQWELTYETTVRLSCILNYKGCRVAANKE
jgi:hypothetical protein